MNQNNTLQISQQLFHFESTSHGWRNREIAFSFDRLTLSRGLNEERKGKKEKKKFIRIYIPVDNTTRHSSREREKERERFVFQLNNECRNLTPPPIHPFRWNSLSLSLSPLLASCNVWNVRPTSLRRERSLAKLSVEKFATSSCTRRHRRCHTISFYIGFGKIGTDFHDIVTNLNIDLSNNFVSNNFLAYWSKHALRASYFE